MPKNWVDDMSSSNVKPIVPTEHIVAFILLLAGICTMEVLLHGCYLYPRSIQRDLGDEQRCEAWRHAILSTSFVYKVAKDDEIFWMVHNNRQKKKSQSITMTLTCLQKIFSVLNHKARLERSNGGKEVRI